MSYKDFCEGLALGLSCGIRPVAPTTSAQYLYGTPAPTVVTYNGVELPDIETVWTDKETYPYAAITYVSEDGDGNAVNSYILTVFESLFNANTSELIMANGARVSALSADGGSWGEFDEISSQALLHYLPYYTVKWTSVDLTTTDGTTYLAASDPVYTQTGGNIGLRVGDTVTLYDGAVLPKMLEVEGCSYAFIEKPYLMKTWYSLFLTPAITYGKTAEGEWCFGWAAGSVNYALLDNEWKSPYEYADGGLYGSPDTATLLWTNSDLLNEDGTVGRAGSAPIPVSGEIVDTIDGIPIYEVI